MMYTRGRRASRVFLRKYKKFIQIAPCFVDKPTFVWYNKKGSIDVSMLSLHIYGLNLEK